MDPILKSTGRSNKNISSGISFEVRDDLLTDWMKTNLTCSREFLKNTDRSNKNIFSGISIEVRDVMLID